MFLIKIKKGLKIRCPRELKILEDDKELYVDEDRYWQRRNTEGSLSIFEKVEVPQEAPEEKQNNKKGGK